NVNSCITMVFGSMTNAAKAIDADWTGNAGESARTLMYRIFKGNEVREEVLHGYIAILRQKISPEYTETENINKTNSDSFK
ncbi:MAG: hypothetical protein FWD23_14720, partial [Oscillospiraceae bacterium]|nr:hypothetical protein [Oscillospiraceae bacterium]